MVWTCNTCGHSAASDSVGRLVASGWSITDPAGGVCPRCVRRARYAVELDHAQARAKERRRLTTETLNPRSKIRNTEPM
jgi:hypothetical protein